MDLKLSCGAADDEIKSLEDLGTLEVVPIPENHKLIDSKWVWKIKLDSTGKPACYKAQLVAQGFSQVPGLDFTETYTPITRLETIRLLMCIANEVKWEIRQVDVKTAYLHRELDEEIYVAAPEGLNVPEGHALCLWKALYGLKQAAKQWHKKLSSVLAEFGLKQISNEPNTFFVRKVTKGELKILVRATLPLTIPSVIAQANQ